MVDSFDFADTAYGETEEFAGEYEPVLLMKRWDRSTPIIAATDGGDALVKDAADDSVAFRGAEDGTSMNLSHAATLALDHDGTLVFTPGTDFDGLAVGQMLDTGSLFNFELELLT